MDDLLDKAPCGFLRLADDGTVMLVNTTLQDLIGYDRAELKQRHVDAILAPGARIFYQTHVFPLLRMEGKVEEIYLSLRSAEGADVPVLLNAVRREDEGFSDWVVMAMRRRNQFEDELLQAKKAAEEGNRAKERFLSMMSHDLRAPLSGISIAAEILARGTIDPVTDRQRDELQRIKRSSQYVLRLVKDILNFARLQSSTVELEMGAVSIQVILDRSASMVQHLMDDAALAFDVEDDASDVAVRADPDRVQQIVLNLLTNAAKFTGAGGRVTVASEHDEDHLLVHVSDTGCGIPDDQLDRIFDPFVQVAPSKTQESGGSVGLGLAISRELARLMGGDLTVTSRVGEGSTFTLRLALAEVADVA